MHVASQSAVDIFWRYSPICVHCSPSKTFKAVKLSYIGCDMSHTMIAFKHILKPMLNKPTTRARLLTIAPFSECILNLLHCVISCKSVRTAHLSASSHIWISCRTCGTVVEIPYEWGNVGVFRWYFRILCFCALFNISTHITWNTLRIHGRRRNRLNKLFQ